MIPTADQISASFKALLSRISCSVREDAWDTFTDLLGLLAGLAFLGSVVLAVVGSGI